MEIVSFVIDSRDLLYKVADNVRTVSRLDLNGCGGGFTGLGGRGGGSLIIGWGLNGNLEGIVRGEWRSVVIMESLSDCSGGCRKRKEEATSHLRREHGGGGGAVGGGEMWTQRSKVNGKRKFEKRRECDL